MGRANFRAERGRNPVDLNTNRVGYICYDEIFVYCGVRNCKWTCK